MTREEAIRVLFAIKDELMERHFSYKDHPSMPITAIDMAIEALSEEQPKGEWQKVDEQPYFRKHFDNVCCSVCHHKGMRKYNFCPNCGAKMKGGAE